MEQLLFRIEPFLSKPNNLNSDCGTEHRRRSSVNQHAMLSLFFPAESGIQAFSFDRPFVDERLEPRRLANHFSCSKDELQETSDFLGDALLDATRSSPSFESHMTLWSSPETPNNASTSTQRGTTSSKRDSTRNDFSTLPQSKRRELCHKQASDEELEPWPWANDSSCSDDEIQEISTFLDGAFLDATSPSPSLEAHSKLRSSEKTANIASSKTQSGKSSIRVDKIKLSNLPHTKRRRLSDNSTNDEKLSQFNEHHDSLWREQFQKLVDFKENTGHCCVPVQYSENQQLARWAKRQRHEYKTFQEGKASATDSKRIQLLESIGFVWDAHASRWHGKWEELAAYKKRKGHCNMASHDSEYPQLSSWVKSQRRQYKLFHSNVPSNMSSARMAALNSIGFSWSSQQRKKQ